MPVVVSVSDPQEALNLDFTEACLKKVGVFAWVVEAASRSALASGAVAGKWRLGSPDGLCLGALVWFMEESHVCVLAGAGARWLLSAMPDVSDLALPPWMRLAAGSPKKQARVDIAMLHTMFTWLSHETWLWLVTQSGTLRFAPEKTSTSFEIAFFTSKYYMS